MENFFYLASDSNYSDCTGTFPVYFLSRAEQSHPFAISVVLTSISGFIQTGLYLHTLCILSYTTGQLHSQVPFRRENVTWLKTPQELGSTPRILSSNVSANNF